MSPLARLFAQGHAIDIVLAVMLAEAAWLIARRGVPARDISGMMLPGALILLAARAALTGGTWPSIALPLALSFPAHIAEVARRGWLRRGRATGAPSSQEELRADQDCVLR